MSENASTIEAELRLPTEEELLARLRVVASKEEAVALALRAAETGIFLHPDGRRDELENVSMLPSQLGLLVHLLEHCNKKLTIEVGFGMGSSAAVILGTRQLSGRPFEHVIFDHVGLPNSRGLVVSDYLQGRFKNLFVREWVESQIGLAQLLSQRGPRVAGLILIDGFHTFEAVMTDFYFADKLCSVGGSIVFDDAAYPAIEAVVEYVAANRPSYSVARFPVDNTVVLRKVSRAELAWGQFRPFDVPQRIDWTHIDGLTDPILFS